MKKQVKGKDSGGVGGRVLLKLVEQRQGHVVQQVLEDPAPGPGACCAVAAQCWLVPRVPGYTGTAVPLKTLRPRGNGEAEETQDGRGQGCLVTPVVDGLSCLGQVELPRAAYPCTTLECLQWKVI